MAEPAIAEFASIEPRVSIHWKAFELRPYPVPTLDPKGAYLTGVWQEHVYPLAEKMGFAMKLPPLQPRTRMAHAAAKWADDNGRFAAFNTAIFKAFFQDSKDIGNLKVLLHIAEELGLQTNKLESAAGMHAYIQKVLNDEETARLAHVKAVPAYVLNGKVIAAGVQGVAQLQQLISRL